MLDLLANDSDIDGDVLSALIIDAPLHGSLSLDPQGVLHYTPEAGYVGGDHLSYRASDGQAQSALTDVELHIIPAPLLVSAFSVQSDGFAVRFNHPFDPDVIDLTVSPGQSSADADVQISGALVGALTGSLILDADHQGFTFTRSGAPLQYDHYSLTLHSGTEAFHDASGGALDGNADGSVGDDYQTHSPYKAAAAAPSHCPTSCAVPARASTSPSSARACR